MITGDIKTRKVFIDGVELDPTESQLVINHSPDGFNWGFGGSGPAQLALAILLRYVPKEKADQGHQQFKWDVIANLPSGDFTLEEAEVKKWIKKQLAIDI